MGAESQTRDWVQPSQRMAKTTPLSCQYYAVSHVLKSLLLVCFPDGNNKCPRYTLGTVVPPHEHVKWCCYGHAASEDTLSENTNSTRVLSHHTALSDKDIDLYYSSSPLPKNKRNTKEQRFLSRVHRQQAELTGQGRCFESKFERSKLSFKSTIAGRCPS